MPSSSYLCSTMLGTCPRVLDRLGVFMERGQYLSMELQESLHLMLFMSPILEGLRSRTNWRGRPHRLSSGTLFCTLWKIKWEGRGIGLIEGYSYRAMLCPMDFPLSGYQQAAIVRAWGTKAGTGLLGKLLPR